MSLQYYPTEINPELKKQYDDLVAKAGRINGNGGSVKGPGPAAPSDPITIEEEDWESNETTGGSGCPPAPAATSLLAASAAWLLARKCRVG